VRGAIAVALGGAVWLAAISAGAAVGDVRLGVAPFERVGASGQEVPDVAGRLAERLGTRGLARVVGPARLGAPAKAEPAPQEIAGPAAEAGVSLVVVGRTTRIGNTLSVDARVLDAATGAPVGSPMVEEVNRPADLGRAVEGLAGQVLERLDGRAVSAPPPRRAAAAAAAGTATAAAAPSAEPAPEQPSKGFDAGAPIAIKADELEVVTEGNARKFVFRGTVEAVQGSLTVNSTRLEAFYPPGGSQPDRLVATGRVLLNQEGRVVTCQKATFYRSDQRVECEGRAQLDQGCDRVRGDKITFFLDREVMNVTGAADVQLRPDAPGCGRTTASAPQEGGP
jgi:lipopolysaccharide export system protein LptA